jgi:hypothetical protein
VLLGLVPLEPGAALLVVLREDEHHRLVTAALTDEAVLMAVCGGTCDRDSGLAELGVE